MADGIRIYHRTARSCSLHVPHPGNPSTGRQPKTYQIDLDAAGEAIVSTTIWRRLEEARAAGWPHGLIVANIVGRPPRQRIDLDPRQRRQTLPIVTISRSAAGHGQ